MGLTQQMQQIKHCPWALNTWLYATALFSYQTPLCQMGPNSTETSPTLAIPFLAGLSLGFLVQPIYIKRHAGQPSSPAIAMVTTVTAMCMTLSPILLLVSAFTTVRGFVSPLVLAVSGLAASFPALQWGVLIGQAQRKSSITLHLWGCTVAGILCAALALLPRAVSLTLLALLPLAQARSLVLRAAKQGEATACKGDRGRGMPPPSPARPMMDKLLPLFLAETFLGSCNAVAVAALASPQTAEGSHLLGAVAGLTVASGAMALVLARLERTPSYNFAATSIVLFLCAGIALALAPYERAAELRAALAVTAMLITDAFSWFGASNQSHYLRRSPGLSVAYIRLAPALGALLGFVALGPLLAWNFATVPFILLGFATLFGCHLESREPVARRTLHSASDILPELDDTRDVGGRCAVLGQRCGLSSREVQTIALVCSGLTRTRIAEKLGISTNTVRAHVYAAYAKLGVHTKDELLKKLEL